MGTSLVVAQLLGVWAIALHGKYESGRVVEKNSYFFTVPSSFFTVNLPLAVNLLISCSIHVHQYLTKFTTVNLISYFS